jgi:hypothetical protein
MLKQTDSLLKRSPGFFYGGFENQMTLRAYLLVGFLFAFAAFLPSAAWADIAAFTAPTLLPSGTDYQANDPVVLGNVFTANANLSVTALGFYYQPNLTGSETLGLYDQFGNLLASTTVSALGPVTNGFLFQSIGTPVALVANTQYTVAAEVGNNPWSYGAAPTTAPGVTFNYNDYLYGNVLAFPTTQHGSGPAYYGTNFQFTPEPGFYGLLALGLSGLGVFARRRRSRP